MKSPASIAAVGMREPDWSPGLLSENRWNDPKKNSRFFTMGPPEVAPIQRCSSFGFGAPAALAAHVLAFSLYQCVAKKVVPSAIRRPWCRSTGSRQASARPAW